MHFSGICKTLSSVPCTIMMVTAVKQTNKYTITLERFCPKSHLGLHRFNFYTTCIFKILVLSCFVFNAVVEIVVYDEQ